MSEAHSQMPANKQAGLSVEDGICRVHIPELGQVPDRVAQHYDAVATTLITPTSDIPMVGLCLLERGTVVEIKSAVCQLADSQRGRFYLRPDQHNRLLDDAGVYLFAVCKRDTRDPLALKVVPATTVSALVPSWIGGPGDRSDFAQLSWSRVFDAEEVR